MTRGATLVTGAASGIGRHLVSTWSARGERIVAADLNVAALEAARLQEGWPLGNIATVALDVTDPAAWSRAWDEGVRHVGPIDRLVNNAGVLVPDWVTALADADIHRQIDVNVKGVIFGTREAARRFVPLRAGHIVNIGSLASLAAVPGLSLYVASKFAVRGFTLSAAAELAKSDVAVSLIMPDAVQTPMLDLQRSRAEAALTFSGGRALTSADVRQAIERAFATKQLELALPSGRARLARFANLFPAISRIVEPLVTRAGLKHQAASRSKP